MRQQPLCDQHNNFGFPVFIRRPLTLHDFDIMGSVSYVHCDTGRASEVALICTHDTHHFWSFDLHDQKFMIATVDFTLEQIPTKEDITHNPQERKSDGEEPTDADYR